MTRSVVYIAGYPKSGTTWLMRLLGDVLDCPIGASVPELDSAAAVTEGWDRPGSYVVRKGHFALVDSIGPVVPAPHQLAWRNLRGEPVVHILRDPRDVAVSTAFYSGVAVREYLPKFLEGAWGLGTWADYVGSWLDTPFAYVLTNYESLSRWDVRELRQILKAAGLPVPGRRRQAAAWKRQSFAQRKKWTEAHGHRLTRGREWHLAFLRKGEVGDWRNYFDREMNEAYWREFGPVMKRLGYRRWRKAWGREDAR